MRRTLLPEPSTLPAPFMVRRSTPDHHVSAHNRETTPLSVDRTRERIGEHDMPLTTVLITIVAAGLLLWIVNTFIPMQGQIKSILNGLVVVVLVLWIANLYGIFDHLHQFRVGRR